MRKYDATEIAYKNGFTAGIMTSINSTWNNFNIELSFGDNDCNRNFIICYHREKPLNRFQIWMFKVCFGIRARNIDLQKELMSCDNY